MRPLWERVRAWIAGKVWPEYARCYRENIELTRKVLSQAGYSPGMIRMVEERAKDRDELIRHAMDVRPVRRSISWAGWARKREIALAKARSAGMNRVAMPDVHRDAETGDGE